MFALDIHNIGIASTPAADAILLDWVGRGPVFVFLDPFLFILRGLLQIGDPGELPSRSVGWAMLDCGVPIAEITEIVDIAGGEKSTGCQGMDRGVTPLNPNSQ